MGNDQPKGDIYLGERNVIFVKTSHFPNMGFTVLGETQLWCQDQDRMQILYWSGNPSNDDFRHDWLYAPGDWWLMFVPCICWLMIVPKDCWFWGWIEPGYWGLVDARLVYPKLGQLSLTLEPEKKVKLWNRFHCTFTCLQKCICDWKCKTYILVGICIFDRFCEKWIPTQSFSCKWKSTCLAYCRLSSMTI